MTWVCRLFAGRHFRHGSTAIRRARLFASAQQLRPERAFFDGLSLVAQQEDGARVIVSVRPQGNQPYSEDLPIVVSHEHGFLAVNDVDGFIHGSDFRAVERTRLVDCGKHLEAALAKPLARHKCASCRVDVYELHSIRDDDAGFPLVLEAAPAEGGLVLQRRVRFEMCHLRSNLHH